MINSNIYELLKFKEELDAISNNSLLYKYLDFDGGLKMLEYHNIQFTRADNLNDEWDCNWDIICGDDYINSILNNYGRYGVCSFTTSPDNTELWSDKYASSKGICIGLNTDILMYYLIYNKIAQPPFKVKYKSDVKSYLTLNELKHGNVDSVTDFFRIKDKQKWEKEKEIRFVTLDILKDEYLRYSLPKECFKSVHVGKDVTEQQIECIKRLLIKIDLKVDIIKNDKRLYINTYIPK